MDQEKIARFIKDIRKKHNLTQKQFADKYDVTYQAVSKWENALNMPDTLLMKQICQDFGISLDELLDGEYKANKKKKYIIAIALILIIIFGIGAIVIFSSFEKQSDFVRTLIFLVIFLTTKINRQFILQILNIAVEMIRPIIRKLNVFYMKRIIIWKRKLAPLNRIKKK